MSLRITGLGSNIDPDAWRDQAVDREREQKENKMFKEFIQRAIAQLENEQIDDAHRTLCRLIDSDPTGTTGLQPVLRLIKENYRIDQAIRHLREMV